GQGRPTGRESFPDDRRGTGTAPGDGPHVPVARRAGHRVRGDMSLDALNAASQSEFLAQIGGPLEGETWLAERVAAHRPFADVDALYRAFEQEVAAAGEAERIALIASHPDLGNKLAVGR